MFRNMNETDRMKLMEIADCIEILCRGECFKGEHFVDDCPYFTSNDTGCELLNHAKQLQIKIEQKYTHSEVK